MSAEENKKYIVVALSVGGLNNKIFKSGDVVTAEAFPQDHAEELVKQGFLKPEKQEPKKVEKIEEKKK